MATSYRARDRIMKDEEFYVHHPKESYGQCLEGTYQILAGVKITDISGV